MKAYELSLHKDPRVFNCGEIDYRSYFIPFESEEKAAQKREASAYFHSLCGEWLFRYADSAFDMPDFLADNRALADFEAVTVPEIWQMHGKDYLQYQTSPYPFVFNPPYPPTKNPCAAYVKKFPFSKNENESFLYTDRVACCDCNHCHSCRNASAGIESGAGKSTGIKLSE